MNQPTDKVDDDILLSEIRRALEGYYSQCVTATECLQRVRSVCAPVCRSGARVERQEGDAHSTDPQARARAGRRKADKAGARRVGLSSVSGVETRLVIDRAQREHEYHESEKNAAPWEKKNRLGEFVEAVNAAPSSALPQEATPEMITAVGTILQPYAAKLVWKRMLEVAPNSATSSHEAVLKCAELVDGHDRVIALRLIREYAATLGGKTEGGGAHG